jgi:hypothetical protein
MKLTSLIEFVGRRIKSLGTTANRAAALAADDFDRERLTTFLTIDLFNLNTEWIRHYYVSVSMNQAVKKNGRKIIIGRKHQTVVDAISYAIDKLNSADAKMRWMADPTRFFEPSWASVNTLPRLANMLEFPDKHTISTSISAGRDAVTTLRAARNFYAHRNVESRKALSNELENMLGWKSFESPSIEILNRRIGPFSNVFSFWLDDSERVIREVCDL